VLRLSGSALTLALILWAAGCGAKNKPVPVNGSVTLDGRPIEGAMVTFAPDGGGGREATAITDKEGAFQLTTFKPNDGALPGSYKVTVDYKEGAVAPPAGGQKEAFAGYEKAQKQKQKPPKYVIPERYSNPAKTQLKFTVPHDGPIKLELKKSG
jgi:hypothetical protein